MQIQVKSFTSCLHQHELLCQIGWFLVFQKKKKHPAIGFSAGGNALLMRVVRAEQSEWFELTGSLW